MTISESFEELENGTRVTTASSDNLQLAFGRADSDAFAAVARAAGGRVEEVPELGLSMSDAGSPCPFGNVAHLMYPLSPADTGRAVELVRAFYGAVQGGPYLLFTSWPTSDL